MRTTQTHWLGSTKPLTTGKVAEILQVTATTVRGMCERGELEGAVRVGNWWRIPRSALDPYVTTRRVQ